MKKAIISCLLIVALLSSAFSALASNVTDNKTVMPSYSDIDGGWYSEYVQRHGYTDIFRDLDGKFNPNMKITRMEFVRLLHRVLGIKIDYFTAPNIGDYFDDVKNDTPGVIELYDLVSIGIIKSNGSFYPNSQLDRELMIRYLIKALDYATGGEYAMILLMPAPFEDNEDISEEYRDDVVKAVILNLIKGYSDKRLLPQQGASRAEAVTVAGRLTELIESLKTDVAVTATAKETSEGLRMSLTILNNSDKAIAIEHTSGQKFDFQLLDVQGEILYTWSADKMFTMALQTTVIEPCETIVFSCVLDKQTFNKIKDSVHLLKAFIVGSSSDFTIDTDGYNATIA